MIKKTKMVVIKSTIIAEQTVEMVLQNRLISNNARPGQFLHIFIQGHTLRRPISIADVDQEREMITILFKIVGSGTKQLAALVPGDVIDVIGPGGNGFPVAETEAETVLLIGGGIGVPPLYYLGKSLVKQKKVIKTILGFQTEKNVFYEQKFAKLGKTVVVTNDGSYGEKGYVTDVLEHVGHFDLYYTCGPQMMLQAIVNSCQNQRGYLSFEERMGCGVGACLACVIPTNDEQGYKKICSDGPVFAVEEVRL